MNDYSKSILLNAREAAYTWISRAEASLGVPTTNDALERRIERCESVLAVLQGSYAAVVRLRVATNDKTSVSETISAMTLAYREAANDLIGNWESARVLSDVEDILNWIASCLEFARVGLLADGSVASTAWAGSNHQHGPGCRCLIGVGTSLGDRL